MKKTKNEAAYVAEAIKSIKYAIKRKGLVLEDFATALETLVYEDLKTDVLALRAKGVPIRVIARKLHVGDRRVAYIIANGGKTKK